MKIHINVHLQQKTKEFDLFLIVIITLRAQTCRTQRSCSVLFMKFSVNCEMYEELQPPHPKGNMKKEDGLFIAYIFEMFYFCISIIFFEFFLKII